jgi:hypothetical protein
MGLGHTLTAYHLSGVKFAVSNIERRRLKISRIEDMNDPFELAAIDASDPEIRETQMRSKAIIDRDHGCICFSKSWSNPVLWAHYAEKHFGVALGFDIADDCMEPIGYIDKPFTLEQERTGVRPKIDKAVTQKWLFTKFVDWKYEDEVRASFKLDHSEKQDGLYFAEFSDSIVLREVILGARCHLPMTEAQRLVSGFSHTVKVTKTRVAFDSFKIVSDDR